MTVRLISFLLVDIDILCSTSVTGAVNGQGWSETIAHYTDDRHDHRPRRYDHLSRATGEISALTEL